MSSVCPRVWVTECSAEQVFRGRLCLKLRLAQEPQWLSMNQFLGRCRNGRKLLARFDAVEDEEALCFNRVERDRPAFVIKGAYTDAQSATVLLVNP